MSFSRHLIAQLDAELHASRRVIERIPASMLEWRPHEKSFDTKSLATHIANLVSWGTMIATTHELDFESEEMQNWSPPTADTVEEIAGLLQTNVEQLKEVLDGMSDQELRKRWVMRSGDQVFSSDSRLDQICKWVMSHQAHHRGQLTVYLRLNDVAVPGIFGPSADEQEM